jgi:hypothetical protein
MSRRLDRAFAVLFATSACAGPGGDSSPAGQANGEDAGRSGSGGGSSTTEGTMGNPGLRGLLTLDEYDWGALGGRLGVIQLDLATGTKRRFLDGEQPSRHPNGTTSFLQACGTGVNRVALADARGLSRAVTACSSELPQPGDTRTRYGFSKLSPDAERIAVEVGYEIYFEGSYYDTAVYDLEGALLAEFEGMFAPAWTPDGRLVLAGEGIYLTDAALSSPERIDGGALAAPVSNPVVHPDGSRIIFEFNQGLWEMNLDGSELRERVYGPARLRYPAYSPEGRSIVYLALPESDFYDRALYFTDLDSDDSYTFDLTGIVGGPADVTIVPNGPLSWTLEDSP